MNEHIIDQIYDRLITTTNDYTDMAKIYTRAKAVREAREAKYLSQGRVAGKNKEIREANLAKLVNEIVHLEKQAEQNMKDARLKLDLAQIEVDRVRLLIRLLELDNRGK